MKGWEGLTNHMFNQNTFNIFCIEIKITPQAMFLNAKILKVPEICTCIDIQCILHRNKDNTLNNVP